jgi:hypothetical protein
LGLRKSGLIRQENDLKTYFEKKTEGAIIRSKACWLREGERNSKFFFNLERRNYINKSIQKVSFSCINFCGFSMNLSSRRRDVLNL